MRRKENKEGKREGRRQREREREGEWKRKAGVASSSRLVMPQCTWE